MDQTEGVTENIQSGLIYNAETKESVGAEIPASNKIKLYCRSKEDENALKGGAWYKSPVNNPPPGQTVEMVYAHQAKENIEYDSNQNPIRSKPFSGYEANQIFYCVFGYYYQKLIIK